MTTKQDEVQIIGAGFAGLLTACAVPQADIFEASEIPIESHKALLRFRDKSVSTLTGIPFREVTVHKEIYSEGNRYSRCSISLANLYSHKVSGAVEDRSIWNLQTVKRYIAPSDFYNQLVDRHNHRIFWGKEIVPETIGRGNTLKIINTAPLPVIMEACGLNSKSVEFNRTSISVTRYRLPRGTDVYQTVYFPDPELRVYRASITGDILIVESIKTEDHTKRTGFLSIQEDIDEFNYVVDAFGLINVLNSGEMPEPETVTQRYGKIIELTKQQREAILYRLTREFNVFSIGRFATWRNILLDDVVKDIELVKRLMSVSSYGRELVLLNR